MATYFKKEFPGIWQFFSSFFKAMSNDKEGHSLRKWLAVGFFWLTAFGVFKYTDRENLAVVLGILTSMITALVITYTVGNVQEKKLENKAKPEGSES